jgi:hypothetical protein
MIWSSIRETWNLTPEETAYLSYRNLPSGRSALAALLSRYRYDTRTAMQTDDEGDIMTA